MARWKNAIFRNILKTFVTLQIIIIIKFSGVNFKVKTVLVKTSLLSLKGNSFYIEQL